MDVLFLIVYVVSLLGNVAFFASELRRPYVKSELLDRSNRVVLIVFAAMAIAPVFNAVLFTAMIGRELGRRD